MMGPPHKEQSFLIGRTVVFPGLHSLSGFQ